MMATLDACQGSAFSRAVSRSPQRVPPADVTLLASIALGSGVQKSTDSISGLCYGPYLYMIHGLFCWLTRNVETSSYVSREYRQLAPNTGSLTLPREP